MKLEQREHRAMLRQIRDQLGDDTLFAEFMVEGYSPHEELWGGLTRWLIDRLRSQPGRGKAQVGNDTGNTDRVAPSPPSAIYGHTRGRGGHGSEGPVLRV
jgi:hypothetical protein